MYIHTYIHTCIHACMHAYIHTYNLTYITLHYITLHYITLHYITLHTYIHTYIHGTCGDDKTKQCKVTCTLCKHLTSNNNKMRREPKQPHKNVITHHMTHCSSHAWTTLPFPRAPPKLRTTGKSWNKRHNRIVAKATNGEINTNESHNAHVHTRFVR